MSHFPTFPAQMPNPDAVVMAGSYRFILLAERLIRIEYNPTQIFEDRPSQVFWHREHSEQPAPKFEVTQAGAQIEIRTKFLTLRCRTDAPPAPETLSISIAATGQTWRYGDTDPANLGGTARTLDCADGPIPLEPGLVSRSGWALVDDSASVIFNEQGWLEPRGAAPGALDLYFFGYGTDFAAALCDYRLIAGQVPLIPRWALGNWWSRYYAYTQYELIQLMLDFEKYNIPLSVCIIDMDWHITETGNQASGWTGYTWNRELFPDPPALLNFLHGKGLKTALNLHPADGVYPHEAAYPAVAERMGIDPASGQP
ncbi:MAG: alpha-xylosidase, partial [Anaerolineae bacterium]|nr:alpha-xylosidase [Anaerolineae bacterium]